MKKKEEIKFLTDQVTRAIKSQADLVVKYEKIINLYDEVLRKASPTAHKELHKELKK